MTRLLSALALALLLAAPAFAAAESDAFAWPRVVTAEKGEVTVYEPQVESFAGDRLEARAAVSVKLKGGKAPVFGAMWFDAHLVTDLEARTATLDRVAVTAARFPESDQAMVETLSRFLEQEIPTWDLVLSIDRLVAALPDPAQGDQGFRADPPVFYVRRAPAVLVLVDGDPIFQALEGYDLETVVNTAFFIVRDRTGTLYLRGSGQWFGADDLAGPWAPTTALPKEMASLSQKIEQEEAEQAKASAEDAGALGLKADAKEAAPEIIVSTGPAELIVTEGEPRFAPVTGTSLLTVQNTESDIVMDIAGQQVYVLAAGRWFRAASLEANQWSFVPFDQLPGEFARIPADSDLAAVLPSVPGTAQAREAVLETQIPQTAEVDRKSATCTVTFDGDPVFEVCADNDVSYARNSDKPVLLIDGHYWCVDSAVWFEASEPGGPWTVATAVPAAVQKLSPECPVYNVKYVSIYDATPDIVYVGYTPGYYGAYVWGPCAVWGTGWSYPYWYHHHYYPRPVTYGFGVHYNPYTGWGFSFGVSYGWLHVGVGWGHAYPAYWGPAGYRYGYRHGYWHGYNHGYAHGYRHGAAAGYRAGYRAGQADRPENLYRARTDGIARTGDVRRDPGKRPRTADRPNNVYADRDGNVVRERDGTWEQRQDGDWKAEAGDRSRDGERDGQAKDRERDGAADRSREADRSRDADRSRAEPQRQDRQQADRQQQERQHQDRQQLERDRQQRDRGAERQRQAPQRQAPQRQAPRGGGARRR
ncbi:MAG TPA: hypothetical protein PLQ13_06270 [Candidatus Krumholzibacteria bacterium]|nr:hypothetical protein [Candidatus Krumholzibacteria bacterium]